MPVVLEKRFDEERGVTVAEIRHADGAAREIDLDALVSWRLVSELERLEAEACPRVVLDLGRVGVVDSATLWALVEAGRKLRLRGGGLALVGLQPGRDDLFELTGSTGVLPVFATLDKAAAALGGK